jgi:nicotinamidase-related amidase
VNQIVRRYGVSKCIATGSEDWKFLDDVQALVDNVDGDWHKVLVGKKTYDAFINTDLEQILHTAAVERVVVCGVMTDFCCDTTARSAFNRGFETWLISDACGTANETQHQAGLREFGFAFGEVLTTKEAISKLESE